MFVNSDVCFDIHSHFGTFLCHSDEGCNAKQENFSLCEFKEHFFKSKKFTYSNHWCSYKFMSQVEVFTELHAYPIFFDIFVHDCGSYEGCYAKRLNFYQY